MTARFSPAALAVLVCLSLLLAPTMVQTFCDPETERCPTPIGIPLKLEASPVEPFISPCTMATKCPRYGPNSWFYCMAGSSIAANGCKAMGPFPASDCSAQCTFSPATADAATVHAYKFGMFASANEPGKTNNPFFHVPAGRVERICIESCDASRGFNELDSLKNYYDEPATLGLYEVIDEEGISQGRGRALPVSQQGFTVTKQWLPAICFKSFAWGSEDSSKQRDVCDSGSAYPATKCIRTCFDNTDNSMDLVPGDRVAVGFTVPGQFGDYGSIRNIVISVYSDSRVVGV